LYSIIFLPSCSSPSSSPSSFIFTLRVQATRACSVYHRWTGHLLPCTSLLYYSLSCTNSHTPLFPSELPYLLIRILYYVL
jgi:hypothetical protein